jgi:hypothetical protein
LRRRIVTRKTKLTGVGVALVAVALLVCGQVVSQERGTEPPGNQQWAEMMAKWAEVNAKGPEHEAFKNMVGTWDTVSRMWMTPGAPPTESVGQAEYRLILDGRFLEQSYKCASMPMAFEGLGLTGYDRFSKKYVSIWMDSMSTGISMSMGTADASGKVFTYYGTVDDPTTGERDIVVKTVIRQLSDDKGVLEVYEKRAGMDEFKSMEITYTRRK